MVFELPFAVRRVLDLLHAAGYRAYVVGGCVRDTLLGRVPQDWDIATGAKPEEMLRIFSAFRVIETGIQHGTVTVLMDGMPLEVTTFRVDGAYTDGRRPDSVVFTADLKEDLRRRDFTINAMAYEAKIGLVDPFDGQGDLARRQIRCVGAPQKRFEEDALRVLRALRFASVLAFSIEPYTAQALHDMCGLLIRVSAERKAAELLRLLDGRGVCCVLDVYGDVMSALLPGYHIEPGAWPAAVRALSFAPADRVVRLALFLDGFPAVHAESMPVQLRLPKAVCAAVAAVRREAASPMPDSVYGVRRLLGAVGAENAHRVLAVHTARMCAAGRDTAAVDMARALLGEAIRRGDCVHVTGLALGGADIQALGVRGPAVGKLLAGLLDAAMEDRVANTRDALLKEAGRMICADKNKA